MSTPTTATPGVAIATGASQGFGRALTAGLVAQGWRVIAAGRDPYRLQQTKDIDPERVVTIRGDITDSQHQSALVDAAIGAGGLDLLVHNASGLGPSPLPSVAEVAAPELLRLYETNVVAPVALTQLALPLLQRSHAPTIVALSSDAAVENYPGWGAYGSSKAALDHLMSVLAAEQPSHSNLVVYAFDPGDMRTAMHQRAFPGEDISDRPEPASVVPAFLELLARRPVSGRYVAGTLQPALIEVAG